MFDKDYNSYIKIGKELGLKYPGGSGIENSDGTRVLEFIEYFSVSNFSFSMKYTFLELILASMNDAILNNIADSNLIERFYEFIKPILIDNRYYPHIPYWISIKSETEFPIGLLLERYIKKDTQ